MSMPNVIGAKIPGTVPFGTLMVGDTLIDHVLGILAIKTLTGVRDTVNATSLEDGRGMVFKDDELVYLADVDIIVKSVGTTEVSKNE